MDKDWLSRNKKVLTLVSVLLPSIFLFYLNFSFISSFYFNGDESYLRKSINLLIETKDPEAFRGFMWQHAIPLFPIPFFITFGSDLIAFRFSQSLMLTLSFLVGFYFVKSFYDVKTAWITVISLLVFPSFVLFMVEEYPFILFLNSLVLLLFSKWYQNKNSTGKKYLYSLLFVLGFGVFTDLVMVYTGISLLSGYLILSFFDESRELSLSWKKEYFFLILFFLLGISPLFYIELKTDFYRSRNLYEQLRDPFNAFPDKKVSSYNNLAIFKNLKNVFKGLNEALAHEGWLGRYFIGGTPLNILIFYLSIGILLFTKDKKDYFLVGFSLSFLFLLTFQPAFFKVYHILYIVFPLMLLISRASSYLIKKKYFKYGGLALLVIFISVNLPLLISSYQRWTDQSNVERKRIQKAQFNSIVSEKYRGEAYFGDDTLEWFLSPDFSGNYLCLGLANSELRSVWMYGPTEGFNCSFKDKIEKGKYYIFPTYKYMEGVMGEKYYQRNTSVKIEGEYYYYPLYSFKHYLEGKNLNPQIHEKIRDSQGRVMFKVYRVNKTR